MLWDAIPGRTSAEVRQCSTGISVVEIGHDGTLNGGARRGSMKMVRRDTGVSKNSGRIGLDNRPHSKKLD